MSSRIKKGEYSAENGIILRPGLHTLFDLNLLRINPGDMKIAVDKEIMDKDYSELVGKRLSNPRI